MNKSKFEFDDFVNTYTNEIDDSIKISGFDVDSFAEYKVKKIKEWMNTINKIIKPTILDFGCGIGLSVKYFEKYFPESIIYGIDISSKSIDYAKKRSQSNAHYTVYDGKNLPFEVGSFDIIFSAGTFHHIPQEEHVALLSEIKRVLSISGIFFLFDLNKYNPVVRYVSKNSRFDNNATLFYPRQIKQVLIKAGFNDAQLKFTTFFPGFLKSFRFLERYLENIPIGAHYCFISKSK